MMDQCKEAGDQASFIDYQMFRHCRLLLRNRSRGGTYLRVQEKENLLFREAHRADPRLWGPETSNFKIDADSIGQPD